MKLLGMDRYVYIMIIGTIIYGFTIHKVDRLLMRTYRNTSPSMDTMTNQFLSFCLIILGLSTSTKKTLKHKIY